MEMWMCSLMGLLAMITVNCNKICSKYRRRFGLRLWVARERCIARSSGAVVGGALWKGERPTHCC
jgi:hypothetical protein